MVGIPAKSKKRKLLVVLGAGSSVPCGMPTVGDIDTQMKIWSSQWESLPTFKRGATPGIFNDLWTIVNKHYDNPPNPRLGLKINYERVLGEMAALAGWLTPAPFGNSLQNTVRDGRLIDAVAWPDGGRLNDAAAWPDDGLPAPYRHRNIVIEQLGSLLTKLACHMREKCKSLNTDSENFAKYSALITTLKDKFDVGIYNLNYDNLAQTAWPDAYNGFCDGRFDARGVGKRQDWNFIYPLHGSVHYSFAARIGTREIVWQDDLDSSFNVCQHLNVEMASEFRVIFPSTFVAGGFKLDQLLAEPAQSFHASLVRHVHEADAILIAGYGFGDVHVNRALRSRFEQTTDDQFGRPPTVVVDRSPLGYFDTVCHRQNHDFWGWEMTHAQNCSFSLDAAKHGMSQTVADLIGAQQFERAFGQRVAVWHGGFLEALPCMDGMLRILES